MGNHDQANLPIAASNSTNLLVYTLFASSVTTVAGAKPATMQRNLYDLNFTLCKMLYNTFLQHGWIICTEDENCLDG